MCAGISLPCTIQEEVKWAMKWVISTLTHTHIHTQMNVEGFQLQCVMKQLRTVCEMIWLREKTAKKQSEIRTGLSHYAPSLMMLRKWNSFSSGKASILIKRPVGFTVSFPTFYTQ